jgi:hypothetical protein
LFVKFGVLTEGNKGNEEVLSLGIFSSVLSVFALCTLASALPENTVPALMHLALLPSSFGLFVLSTDLIAALEHLPSRAVGPH